MTKLMRKYQKWLLAVFGSLLMVTFLVQGVLGQMQGNPGRHTVAHVAGRSVSAAEKEVSSLRYAILEDRLSHIPSRLMGILDADHWFLLVHEARAGGFVGHAGDGEAFLGEIVQNLAEAEVQRSMRGRPFEEQIKFLTEPAYKEQLLQPVQAAMMDQLKNSGAPVDRPGENSVQGFNEALAELRGVLRMLQTNVSTPRLSDRATRVALLRQQTSAVVDAIVLDGTALATSSPAPTREQLEARFREGQAAATPAYVLPARVRVEWLAIEKAALASAVRLDPVVVRKHWMQNRARYTGEFAAERPRVEQDLTEAEVSRLMGEADRAVKSQVTIAIKDLAEVNGFRTVTPEWSAARPTLAQIAAKVVDVVKTATGVTIPTPKVESRDGLLTAEELSTLPGIGGATVESARVQTPLSRLAMQVKELEPVPPVQGLQVGIPFTSPLTNMAGDHFYVLVSEARKSAPAESVDEVLARVEADVRATLAYEKLMGNAESFKSLAVTDGLDGVGRLAVEGTTIPAPTPRVRQSVSKEPGAGDPVLGDKAVVDAVWAVAGSMDPAMEPAPETLPQRTIVVGLPEQKKIVVARVLQNKPLTVEGVRRLSQQQLRQILQEEQKDLVALAPSDAYSLEMLKARLGYEESERRRDEKKPAKAADAKKADGKGEGAKVEKASQAASPSAK